MEQRMKLKSWQKVMGLAAETSGAEIAEAAVVLPLLFMLLFVIMWFGRAFNIYATINHAAREAALAAAAPNCATCGNTFTTTAGPLQTNVVNPILSAAHLDPGQVQNFTLQTDVILNPASSLQEHGTVVSFDYPYSFRLNGITFCPPTLSPISTGITLKAKAQARREN
jgi:hypothetical protein